MLAKQLVWAADMDAARNEAFNIVNGDLFRWSWLWGKLAEWFDVPAVGFKGSLQPLEAIMANDQAQCREMAQRHGLAEPALDEADRHESPLPGSPAIKRLLVDALLAPIKFLFARPSPARLACRSCMALQIGRSSAPSTQLEFQGEFTKDSSPLCVFSIGGRQ
jgi:hypothetical protein